MAERFFNSEAFFRETLIDPLGFREYDARWVIRPVPPSLPEVQVNYRGITQIGNWLGRFLSQPQRGSHRQVLVGHDYRDYSQAVKDALVLGLLAAGINVVDVGLATTPMAYFLQYSYSVPAVAMITASHNPNGWTGIKMGGDYSETFDPGDMSAFVEFANSSGTGLSGGRSAGLYRAEPDGLERYLSDFTDSWSSRLRGLPRFKVAVETGNGTAGMVMPRILANLGFDVAEGNTELDWDFPHFNPNPESIPFLRSVQGLVENTGAQVGLCLDGDGDRLGVIDDRGRIVFADRVALLIARHLEALNGPGTFVIDVKSTSLFERALESRIVWEKTGHSYLKRALPRESALAAFERSGHYFFPPPLGRGYDDGCLSAMVLLWIICEAKGTNDSSKFSDLLADLPESFQSPNRQPLVPEAEKYRIVDRIRSRIEEQVESTGSFAGRRVSNMLTINGIRLNMQDGSWLLVRASSNTPNLVIVAESFGDDGAGLKEMDESLRSVLSEFGDIGDFEPLYET